MKAHPYRALSELFDAEQIFRMHLGRLDEVAGNPRHAIAHGHLDGIPRSKLARVVCNLESAHASLSASLGGTGAILTSLIALLTLLAGIALKVLAGAWAFGVALALAALVLFLGFTLAMVRMNEAVLARVGKAHDELLRHVCALPIDEPSTGVRVDVEVLASEDFSGVSASLRPVKRGER